MKKGTMLSWAHINLYTTPSIYMIRRSRFMAIGVVSFQRVRYDIVICYLGSIYPDKKKIIADRVLYQHAFNYMGHLYL